MLSDTLTNEANMQMALFCTISHFFFFSQRLKVQMIKKKVFSFFQLIVIDALKKVFINSNTLCRVAAKLPNPSN